MPLTGGEDDDSAGLIRIFGIEAVEIVEDRAAWLIGGFRPSARSPPAASLSFALSLGARSVLDVGLLLLLPVHLGRARSEVGYAALPPLRAADAVPPVEVDRDRVEIHRHESAMVGRVLASKLAHPDRQIHHLAQRAYTDLDPGVLAVVFRSGGSSQGSSFLLDRPRDLVIAFTTPGTPGPRSHQRVALGRRLSVP